MYDVIALDLDGTLLRNDKTISDNTIKCLKKYEGLGKQIIIVTARPQRLEPIRLPVELQKEYMIFYNGAEIYHNNKRIYRQGISVESAKSIMKFFLKNNIKCKIGFEIDNKLYTNFKNDSIFGTDKFETVDLADFELKSPTKILLDMSNIFDIESFKMQLPPDCKLIITDNGKLGQIMDHRVNKSIALKYVLNEIGTSIDRVLFFGDDMNDIELIMECGIGVAMGNAAAKVKEVADYITSSNEEDGIVTFLNNFPHDCF